MSTRAPRLRGVALIVWLLVLLAGCSTFRAVESPKNTASAQAMTQAKMEVVFASLVDAIDGPPGAIRTQVDGVDVFLISDPENDRMQMVVKIALAENLGPRYLLAMLQANFHRTRDARYAISSGVVYATYLHSISTLTRTEIESALHQLLSLRESFGTSFSSGAFSPKDPSSN